MIASQPRKLFQPRVREKSKQVGLNLFLLTTLVLLLLPFWTSLQDVLTRLVMSVGWYREIQNLVVPYELRLIQTVLLLLKFPIRVGQTYIEWTSSTGRKEVIYLIWNCVGWQTVLLFGVTLLTGLSGDHTVFSKVEALVIGILGTYWLNLLRLVLVVIVYFISGRVIGTIFHDYFSSLLTLSWLFIYWHFSYKYILEKK